MDEQTAFLVLVSFFVLASFALGLSSPEPRIIERKVPESEMWPFLAKNNNRDE